MSQEDTACPCGLSRELVVAGHMHDSRGICTAIGADGNPCGCRLADHPSIHLHQPPRSAYAYPDPHLRTAPYIAHGHHHEETHQYHLEDVNGSLTGLSEVKGFRNYVASRIRAMGLKGYIKRVPRQHAKLVVTGTPAQISEVEDFLAEMEDQGMLHGHFREAPEMIPVSRTFKILSSGRRYVLTGSYSDAALDEVESHFTADEPILREPAQER